MFLDKWNLLPGQPWQPQLEKAVEASKTVLVFIGQQSLGPWQQQEVSALLYRLHENPSFRVIPVLGPGSDPERIPLFLKQFTFIDLRHLQRGQVDELVRRIGAITVGADHDRPYSPRVFLCHAKEDSNRIESLYFALGKAGLDPWYDKEKLIVGDRWKDEIVKAIAQSDFFAACLSQTAVKKKGFIQKEIRTAVKEYQRRPEGIAYLLPIRLDDCDILRVELDDTTSLSDLHWHDVFDGDEQAVQDLIAAIWAQWRRTRAE